MKKRKYLAVLSATAIATLLTTSVFAANGDVYKLADKSLAYNQEQMVNLKNQKYVGMRSSQYGYEYNGKVYKLEDVNKIYAEEAGNLDLAGILNKVSENKEAAFPVEEEEQELKVESVSAINAKTLEVKFSQEVDKVAAETKTNYEAVGITLPVANSGNTKNYELQKDNKTVVITLGTAIANDKTFVVTVNEIPSKADASIKSALYTKTITFSDTVKPALVDIRYPQAGKAVLNFTEELSTEGTVKVFLDGEEAAGITSALTEDNKGIELAGLKANKEYNVVVLGAKDWSGNLTNPNPIEVTVKSTVVDEVDPEVVSVEAVGLDTLKVKFSEPLRNLKDGTTITDDKYLTLTLGTTPITGETQSFDEKTNTVTVTLSSDTSAGVQAVKVSGYKDLAGNTGEDYTKNVVFAALVSALEKTEVVNEVVSGQTKTFVKLTFNTDVSTTTFSSDITATVVTPENVEDTATIASGKFAMGSAANKDENIIKIDVTDLDAGKYEFTLANTALTPNAKDDIKVTFELEEAVDATVPKVAVDGDGNAEIAITNKTVTVEYDAEMGQSALDVNNYTVSGQKVFEKAIFKGDKTKVELTFKEGSIKYNGEYELEISTNVKADNGVALKEAYTYTSSDFKENVAPTITKAQFDGADKIVLTFSEKVKSAADVTGIEVYVDGAKCAVLDTISQISTADDKVTLSATAGNEFVEAEDFATANVVIKVLKDNNITDENGNELKATTITVAK